MILRIIFSIISSLVFLFFFWRKLKEDYTQNQLFSVAFYSLFGILVFSLIGSYLAPEWVFWLSMLGSFIGFIIGVGKYHFRFLEALEAWVLGNLWIILALYIYEFIIRFNFSEAVGVLFLIFIIFLFLMLDKHYKKFTWYKSGRVGFTGLMILGLVFLARCLIAIVLPGMLFFVGKADAILSGSIAFISFLTLFNRARD